MGISKRLFSKVFFFGGGITLFGAVWYSEFGRVSTGGSSRLRKFREVCQSLLKLTPSLHYFREKIVHGAGVGSNKRRKFSRG